MDYFYIKYNSNNTFIKHISLYLDIKDIVNMNYSKLDYLTAVFSVETEYNNYTDILNSQLFLIKKHVKEVFDIYIKDYEYKVLCILDKKKIVMSIIMHLYLN